MHYVGFLNCWFGDKTPIFMNYIYLGSVGMAHPIPWLLYLTYKTLHQGPTSNTKLICPWRISDPRHQVLDPNLFNVQVPILFNLSEPQRVQLAQRMTPRNFVAGELVFSKGDQGACVNRVLKLDI